MAQRSDSAAYSEASATTTNAVNPEYSSNQSNYFGQLVADGLGTQTQSDIDFSLYALCADKPPVVAQQPADQYSPIHPVDPVLEKLLAELSATTELFPGTQLTNMYEWHKLQPDASSVAPLTADHPETKEPEPEQKQPDASSVAPLTVDQPETKQPEKEQPEKKQPDTWEQYIKDYVAVPGKGGYTADQYQQAWEDAAKTSRPVVLVLDAAKNGLLLQATANGVQDGHAVYIYADTNKLDPSSPLGQYAKQVLNDSANLESPNHAAIVAFHVHKNDDGTMDGDSAAYINSIHSDDWNAPIQAVEASLPPTKEEDEDEYLDVTPYNHNGGGY